MCPCECDCSASFSNTAVRRSDNVTHVLNEMHSIATATVARNTISSCSISSRRKAPVAVTSSTGPHALQQDHEVTRWSVIRPKAYILLPCCACLHCCCLIEAPAGTGSQTQRADESARLGSSLSSKASNELTQIRQSNLYGLLLTGLWLL